MNKTFNEDVLNINKYKSVNRIRMYCIKITQSIFKNYLENLNKQKIKKIQNKQEKEREKIINNYTQEQSKERLINLTNDYEHRRTISKEEQRKQRELNKLDK